MKPILAIDPGDVESAYALIDVDTRKPIEAEKVTNEELLARLIEWCVPSMEDVMQGMPLEPKFDRVAIEMIASYGMPVGKEVFETCVWIGRFQQLLDIYAMETPCDLIYRREVKLHHCQSSAAKDSNITAALRDRFAPGESNYGKGTKANPGWFYGFSKDVWQAYALAVQQADVLMEYQP